MGSSLAAHALREGARLAWRGAQSGRHAGCVGESMTTRSPIRTLRLVAPDGSARIQVHVHCPARQRSVDLGRCITCPRAVSLDTVDVEGRRAIECNVAEPPRARHVDAATVGEVMCLETVCVSSDALLGEVKWLAPARACVVNGTGSLCGLLDLAASPPSPDDARTPAAEAMVAAVQVREDATLDDALHAMVRAHVRVLTVTRDDGTVVGLIDDLAILRWFAEHRES